MRFVYSTAQYLPDIARGECVNVGIVVGSDESSEWDILTLSNPQRARRFGDPDTFEDVISFIDILKDQLDAYREKDEADQEYLREVFEHDLEPCEDWLTSLSTLDRSILRFTPPAPMTADSLSDAIRYVSDLKLVESPRHERNGMSRRKVSGRLRSAYHGSELDDGDLYEQVVLSTAAHRGSFDFAVANGSLLQLAHSWSFVAPPRDLAQQIMTWGWKIKSGIDRGATITTKTGLSWPLESEVEIAVVYALPTAEDSDELFAEGQSVFDTLEIDHFPLKSVNDIALRACELTGVSSKTP